jgi:hypothetical protein
MGRRIAASVVVLLAAAAACVVVADRTALESAKALPWISSLPSYLPNVADWPILRERPAAGRASADKAALGEPFAPEDALLSRAAWPTGS